jgi:hypothetical protein
VINSSDQMSIQIDEQDIERLPPEHRTESQQVE